MIPLLPAATTRQIINTVNQMLRGHTNAAGTVTLRPSETTTTVLSDVVTTGGLIQLTPITLHAAAALATTYVSTTDNGAFTVTHASTADTDVTFNWQLTHIVVRRADP